MSFAGCEAELHRQASGVDDSVNLAGKPASRPAHMFLSIPRDMKHELPQLAGQID